MNRVVEYHIVQQLYTRNQLNDEDLDTNQDEDNGKDDKPLNLSKVNIFKSNIIRVLPKKSSCHKLLNKEEKLFIAGVGQLREKVNISSFLQEFADVQQSI